MHLDPSQAIAIGAIAAIALGLARNTVWEFPLKFAVVGFFIFMLLNLFKSMIETVSKMGHG